MQTEVAVTKPHGLAPGELDLIRGGLAKYPAITGAILFGSRAKGTAQPASDIDLALEGIDDPLLAEAIASELEELPLPYRFDVKALSAIRHPPLRDHIVRAGVRIALSVGSGASGQSVRDQLAIP
ncbi:MAG: nucleotidyltransferase domain-containing protein [Magnetospirillum sp. WYHS-4]